MYITQVINTRCVCMSVRAIANQLVQMCTHNIYYMAYLSQPSNKSNMIVLPKHKGTKNFIYAVRSGATRFPDRSNKDVYKFL